MASSKLIVIFICLIGTYALLVRGAPLENKDESTFELRVVNDQQDESLTSNNEDSLRTFDEFKEAMKKKGKEYFCGVLWNCGK